MPRVNFQEVAQRFGHIDGTFVAANLGYPDSSSTFFRFRYYPCWEHPLYLRAVARNEPWGFDFPESAAKEVCILPVDMIEFRLTAGVDCTDAWFTQDHPLLWSYEEEGQLFVNQPTNLADVGDYVRAQLGSRAARAESRLTTMFFSEPARSRATAESFSLRLPRTLHTLVREWLERTGTNHLVASEPREQQRLWMFYLDEQNYIVARDFEVDMPEFEFRPEWFKVDGS